MRVKDFDDKLHGDVDFIWFTHSHFPATLSEGKRIDAGARLLRLCRKSYNLAGTVLEANPAPAPPPAPPPAPAPPEVPDGTESASVGGEGATDST